MRVPHWLACRWAKWEPYTGQFTRTAQVLRGVTVPLDRPVEYSEKRERRRCEVCGRTQDREIGP